MPAPSHTAPVAHRAPARRPSETVVVDVAQHPSTAALASILATAPSVVIVDLSGIRPGPDTLDLVRSMHRHIVASGATFAVTGLRSTTRALLVAARLDPVPVVYPAVPAMPPWSEGGTAHFV